MRLDLSVDPPRVVRRPDPVVVEEPLTIRVDGAEVTTTMRTPGDDFDLAIGHLVAEGLLGPGDVEHAMHCTDVDASGSPTFNVVDVTLRPGRTLRRAPDVRTEVATSACGVCGKASVDDALARLSPVEVTPWRFDVRAVPALVDRMREAQSVFDRTGGLHAAALFSPTGELVVTREDVGRHNAVDKVVGAAARSGSLPLADHALLVSARAGFEIVQKAAAAGIPGLVAVSAPTSLAVDLAAASGVTLLAFAREDSVAAYTHAERLDLPAD
jgi:FdhD protein